MTYLDDRLKQVLDHVDLVEKGLADGVLWDHAELKVVRTKLEILIKNIDRNLVGSLDDDVVLFTHFHLNA